MDSFFDAFPHLAGKRIWLAGESYAGYYVPYFADWLTHNTEYVVQGIYLGDALISHYVLQQYLPVLGFVESTNQFIHLNDTAISSIKNASDQCDWTGYADRNLRFPPKGPLESYNHTYCPTWERFSQAATAVNPLFNMYRVNVVEPLSRVAPLGIPGLPSASPNFFNNKAMQKKIHALRDDGSMVDWQVCSVSAAELALEARLVLIKSFTGWRVSTRRPIESGRRGQPGPSVRKFEALRRCPRPVRFFALSERHAACSAKLDMGTGAGFYASAHDEHPA